MEPEHLGAYLIRRRRDNFEIVSGCLRSDGFFMPMKIGQLDSEVSAFMRHEYLDDTCFVPGTIKRVCDTFTIVDDGRIVFKDYLDDTK